MDVQLKRIWIWTQNTQVQENQNTIIGHKLGKKKEPVVYVKRRYLDYDSDEITEGVPDPFVERLTHDSIIVQVPYLKGKARNRVEKILYINLNSIQVNRTNIT